MSLMSEIKTKKCSVRGCVDNVSRRHRFPNPRKISETIIEAWRENTNNPSLANLSHDQLHKSFYVCDRHFASSDIVCGLRSLKVDAVPTEFLHKDDDGSNDLEASIHIPPKKMRMTLLDKYTTKYIGKWDLLSNMELTTIRNI
ncbi:hypothetical protein ILUMI_02563 [Ignelater luminosus]|uniref:THAP-type domain-containing protein n=1 Tax=Ignelater luminosus TaxID=2038154 RepID=A0A8K0GL92_IGNLU|nr:hypothetical protein ILUMI_02563 [Ignelater luminosus]